MKILHEYTHVLSSGELWSYRVAETAEGIAIQVKHSEGDGWSTVGYGSGPPEIARLAKRIEELEKKSVYCVEHKWHRCGNFMAKLEYVKQLEKVMEAFRIQDGIVIVNQDALFDALSKLEAKDGG